MPPAAQTTTQRCAAAHGCWSSPVALTLPGAGAGDDPGAAVRQLAMAVAAARDAGRPLGRLAVPSRRLAEPAPRRRDDGHADLGRHAGRLRLVGVRAVLPAGDAGHADDVRVRCEQRCRNRRDLPRGRGRRDDVHPRRPLLRGAGEAALRRRVEGAARARREGRRRARGDGSERRVPIERAARSAIASSYVPARRSPPTGSSRKARRRSTSRC